MPSGYDLKFAVTGPVSRHKSYHVILTKSTDCGVHEVGGDRLFWIWLVSLINASLLIIGASCRSAVFSALRAGFRPVCLDRYADADLQPPVQSIKVQNFPSGIADALGAVPQLPCLYTGPLENSPDLLRLLEQRGPLIGNPANIVEVVRDPVQLAKGFAELGLPLLKVRPATDPPPQDGRWMIKPIRSAGGRDISVWQPDNKPLDEPYFFQQRADGESYSAVFVGPSGRGNVRFVGVTRQLIGDPLLHAPSFAWCGSVGPVTLSVEAEHLIRRIGNVLSWKFGLCGLFGCDFILDADDVPRLTEVNPRYPASAEVLEQVLEVNLLSDHCAAFGLDVPMPRPCIQTPPHALGKFVLYSDRSFQAPSPESWLPPELQPDSTSWSRALSIADIPPAGQRFSIGNPICTLFTRGYTPAECLDQLPGAVAEAHQNLVAAAG
ncbi:MAG: ATP-grasp domain-containing protein [Planctomycetota bacterium]|nr:MAG: ATP-grasp domain-containing protein [Planctomycetota bacterium]